MQGDTPLTLVNRAILMIGDNTPAVTGNLPTFDKSPAGLAAGALYTAVVQTIARSYGFDFSRNTARLAPSGGAAPPDWTYEYVYPVNGIEILQLMPVQIADKNNPAPISHTVGYSIIAGVNTKVIWADLAGAMARITGQPPEALWDALFAESVVSLLSSELAMAIPGRPSTAASLLERAQGFEQIGEQRGG